MSRPEVVSSRQIDSFQGSVNPDRIADYLANRRDSGEIIRLFQAGNEWTRDSAYLTTNQRARVAEAGRQYISGSIDCIDDALAEVIQSSTDKFALLMRGQLDPGLQENAGWNFLVNARGFISDGYPWAANLDGQLAYYLGINSGNAINTLLYNARIGVVDEVHLKDVIANFASDDSNKFHLLWYLAERSLVSESYQHSLYHGELLQAKSNAINLLDVIGGNFGLSPQSLARASKQIELTEFSGFDHLLYGVTELDCGGSGDYIPGTLRVEAKFEGSPSNPQHQRRAYEVIQHELFHSSSSQTPDGSIGLRLPGGEGTEANEAMTELLANFATGQAVIDRSNRVEFTHLPAYSNEVGAMAYIFQNYPGAFGSLFRAYYGDIEDRRELAEALRIYYTALDYSSN